MCFCSRLASQQAGKYKLELGSGRGRRCYKRPCHVESGTPKNTFRRSFSHFPESLYVPLWLLSTSLSLGSPCFLRMPQKFLEMLGCSHSLAIWTRHFEAAENFTIMHSI